MNYLCIICYREIPDFKDIYRCECKAAYTTELLRNADPTEWQAILRRDGYEVKSQLLEPLNVLSVEIIKEHKK